jgi:hypothetical protein
MEREKKTRKHSGSFHSGGPARKKTETNVKLDSSVRTVTDGWPMKHTQGVYCHGQKKRGRKLEVRRSVLFLFSFKISKMSVGLLVVVCEPRNNNSYILIGWNRQS